MIVTFTWSPMQKAMMNLCTAMAKHKYQTKEALVPRPIAIPSKTACNEMANMMKKPLMATWNEASLIFAKTSVGNSSWWRSPFCPVNYDWEIWYFVQTYTCQSTIKTD